MLKPGQKIVGNFPFDSAMPRAASIYDNELASIVQEAGLSAIVELHPKPTDIIPEAFEGRTMNTQLEVERPEWVGTVPGIQWLKWRGDIEIAGWSPTR